MLEIGAFVLRTETEPLIRSRRVVPGKLLTSGFQFRYPNLLAAVEHFGRPYRASVLPMTELAPFVNRHAER